MKKQRCGWATASLDTEYHDTEWGVPVRDDHKLFEMLILEGAQAGLSWSTILNKRAGYRKALDNFDVRKVARYTDKKIARLLENPAIVRNRLKIASTVTNARNFIKVQEEFGSFSDYIWGFVEHEPINNKYKHMQDVPSSTPISDTVSKDLKKRGFKFVGTTICYAHMQATGMVNDHLTSCFRHKEVIALQKG